MCAKSESCPMSKPHQPEGWANIRAVHSSKGEEAEGLVAANKMAAAWYRDSLQIVKLVYDRAFYFLKEMLDEPQEAVQLPVDIRKVAEKCHFTISFEALPNQNGSNRISSVAQLQMRRKLSGNCEITGTIRLANYLSETSARFSIAHELGHYVLREHSPIGLNYILAACPGLYPLADTDELLADLFAYGLLLPYPAFLRLKEKYEEDDSRWPIDFSDWISYLQEQTQMPEYHVVLAYQGIKQYSLAKKLEYAQEKAPLYLKELIEKFFHHNLTKDQIIEALKFERQNPQESGRGATDDLNPEDWELQDYLQEIVETVQDRIFTAPLSDGTVFGDEDSLKEFPPEWKKRIIQNLYQQGISTEIVSQTTGAEQCLIDQYTGEIKNTEDRSGS